MKSHQPVQKKLILQQLPESFSSLISKDMLAEIRSQQAKGGDHAVSGYLSVCLAKAIFDGNVILFHQVISYPNLTSLIDINKALEPGGKTALHICSQKGFTYFTVKLLQMGANFYVLDKQGNNFLDLAKNADYKKSIELTLEELMQKPLAPKSLADQAKLPAPVKEAATKKVAKTQATPAAAAASAASASADQPLEMLLESGVQISSLEKLKWQRSREGGLFIKAIREKNVEFLTRAGKGKNIYKYLIGQQLKSFLEIGAKELAKSVLTQNLVGMVELISSFGSAIVNFPLKNKVTSVHLAACMSEHNFITLLLAYGGNPSALDENMEAPIHYAAVCGGDEIVKILQSVSDEKLINSDEISPAFFALSCSRFESFFRLYISARLSMQTEVNLLLTACSLDNMFGEIAAMAILSSKAERRFSKQVMGESFFQAVISGKACLAENIAHRLGYKISLPDDKRGLIYEKIIRDQLPTSMLYTLENCGFNGLVIQKSANILRSILLRSDENPEIEIDGRRYSKKAIINQTQEVLRHYQKTPEEILRHKDQMKRKVSDKLFMLATSYRAVSVNDFSSVTDSIPLHCDSQELRYPDAVTALAAEILPGVTLAKRRNYFPSPDMEYISSISGKVLHLEMQEQAVESPKISSSASSSASSAAIASPAMPALNIQSKAYAEIIGTIPQMPEIPSLSASAAADATAPDERTSFQQRCYAEELVPELEIDDSKLAKA